MNVTSIYKEHYLGETYRVGVAYLRARTPNDDRSPRSIGTYPLNQQREIIAKAARRQQTIIVAEFIEYGDRHPGYRPAFRAATSFACDTHVPILFVAREEYLTRRRDDFPLLMRSLADADITLAPAYDRPRSR
jgi:hypothetical protein